jgi:hypothetical protein
MGWIALPGRPKAPLRTASETRQTHQLGDLVAAYTYSFTNQFRVNARAAIDPAASCVDAPDLDQQLAITLHAGTVWPLAPSVVAAGRHSQQAAHQTHRVGIIAILRRRLSQQQRITPNRAGQSTSSTASARSGRQLHEPFVADIDTALVQQIFRLAKQQRVAHVHQHHEADDLG